MSTLRGSRRAAPDVIGVDGLVDVVALQYDLLRQDPGLFAAHIQRVESGAEKAVGLLVAVAQRVPVEAQVEFAVALPDDLDIRNIVAGPRLRCACAGALGLDP